MNTPKPSRKATWGQILITIAASSMLVWFLAEIYLMRTGL